MSLKIGDLVITSKRYAVLHDDLTVIGVIKSITNDELATLIWRQRIQSGKITWNDNKSLMFVSLRSLELLFPDKEELDVSSGRQSTN